MVGEGRMSDSTLRSGLIRLAHANPNLRADLLPLLKAGSEFGPKDWDLLNKVFEGDRLSSEERTRAPGLVRMGLLGEAFDDPAHPWFLTSKGGRALQGGRPLEADPSKEISDALKRLLSSSGVAFDEPSVEGKEVTGGYRSPNLPKEGAYQIGEGEYERLVQKEVSTFRKKLDLVLAPFRDKIRKVSVNDGEKSWVYVTVLLKG